MKKHSSAEPSKIGVLYGKWDRNTVIYHRLWPRSIHLWIISLAIIMHCYIFPVSHMIHDAHNFCTQSVSFGLTIYQINNSASYHSHDIFHAGPHKRHRYSTTFIYKTKQGPSEQATNQPATTTTRKKRRESEHSKKKTSTSFVIDDDRNNHVSDSVRSHYSAI